MEFSTLQNMERGVSSQGMPWAKIGSGPSLVVLEGLTLDSGTEGGLRLQGFAQTFETFKSSWSVWLVSLPPRLEEGATMATLAAHYGQFLEEYLPQGAHIGGMGFSGALALQTAADFPGLVHSVGILSGGPQLSPWARLQYQALFDLAMKQKYRGVHSLMARWMFKSPLGKLLGGALAGAFSGDLGHPEDPWNFLVCLQAEKAFDGRPLASKILAPLFWSIGQKDPLYTLQSIQSFLQDRKGLTQDRIVVTEKEGYGVYKIKSDLVHDQWKSFLESIS